MTPRSSGLRSVDIFLSRHVKARVYLKKYTKDMCNLKIRIIEEFEAIKKKTLHNILLKIEKRLNFCISAESDNFE